MDEILEFIFEFIMEIFGAIVEEIIDSILPEDRRNSKWIKLVAVVFSIICVVMVLALILGAGFLISDDGDKKLGIIFLGVSISWFAVTTILSVISKIRNKTDE